MKKVYKISHAGYQNSVLFPYCDIDRDVWINNQAYLTNNIMENFPYLNKTIATKKEIKIFNKARLLLKIKKHC